MIKSQNRKTFASTFNQKYSQQEKIKLHENWSTIRNLAYFHDGKYIQKMIAGEELKRSPSKSELVNARNN